MEFINNTRLFKAGWLVGSGGSETDTLAQRVTAVWHKRGERKIKRSLGLKHTTDTG